MSTEQDTQGARAGQGDDAPDALTRIERRLSELAEANTRLLTTLAAVAEFAAERLTGHAGHAFPPAPHSRQHPAATTGPDKETQAIAALLTIGPNVAAIARSIGVARPTLYGWPKFRDALSRATARTGKGPRRGYKSRETGDFDAYDDGDDDE